MGCRSRASAAQAAHLTQSAVLAAFLIAVNAVTAAPTAVITSPSPPADVDIPQGFAGNPIEFFDDYSWRSFVAMVWPALRDHRGEPDTTQSVGGSGPRVFETYKHLWEVFHGDGSAPATWDALEDRRFNPCDVATGWGDLTLGSFSKFSDLGQAGVGTLVGPLVAQPASTPTYVRYLTSFNRIEFDFIVDPNHAQPPKPLYLRANLAAAAPMTFPNGSIDVKSAWMVMTAAPHPERYYTRSAWVLDPATGKSEQVTVGLVGIHIVQKTPTRPQWIWSTFEQVDTVPPADAGAPGTFAFNDGTTTAMPAKNPYSVSPLPIPTPSPYNVTRAKPIHPNTHATNQAYRAALAGTVWANYQLVMTQWPLAVSQPALPGTPDKTFPGFGTDGTAFANTTMETFQQDSVRTGCMNCHNSARASTDFIWSLQDHAFPPVVPSLLLKEPAVRNLRNLMTPHDSAR